MKRFQWFALLVGFAACSGNSSQDTATGGTGDADADTDADTDTDIPQGGNGPVWVNEVMPANFSTLQDELGAYPDWVEIWNGSDADVDLSGWFLTDDPTWTDKWAFPPGTVAPVNGYVIAFCDKDVLDGPLHTSFQLKALGESVGIYTPLSDGNTLVDVAEWTGMLPDKSWARQPDGGAFAVDDSPTPDNPND